MRNLNNKFNMNNKCNKKTLFYGKSSKLSKENFMYATINLI